ncbi:succinate dehydrogenase/fumarate reductase flavoprotein subunit [Neobacillus niacini]|uniref:FAD-binding protein n=1 Tax=Neobacillus niacini TaxID=86668 RepID=UPI00285CB3BD|nr:FAD-binding protein [Neobacillus niacini]MDR7078972.1 succinate dehydrogenase/fumarate reductase flavoprotein subunit [Neobacillus niacini]
MIKEIITTDVLVVGSGIAGLKVSMELAKAGQNIIMSTKTQLCSGSSFFPLKASLGTQVTKNDEDKTVFLEDIDAVSHNMQDREMAKIYIDEIRDRVEEFPEIGIEPYKLSDDRKACFANHGRTIYMLKDWNKIRENVSEIMENYPNISLMERTAVVSLLKQGERISGAILLDRNNDFIMINSKAVILATGGFGNIYKHNLNPNDVDGSGHILALEAGASLVNMEFIQFIPGFTSPKYKTLWGEHTLNYCEDFVNASGNSILDGVLPEGLSKEECFKVRSTHGPFTNSLPSKYFDIAMMKEILSTKSEEGFELIYDAEIYKNATDFYTIYLNWLEERGINLVRDTMKIAPFAHASNGGVKVDSYGRTGVPGLYAIGELAGGIEGANRLGGNSTGACMVFGKRAAQDCLEFVESVNLVKVNSQPENIKISQIIHSFSANTEDSLTPHDVMEAVREIMWFRGNVIRDEKNLLIALEKIEEMKSAFSMEYFVNQVAERKSAFKARNFLILSSLLLKAMLERKESRGAHYREDYPAENEFYNKRLLILLNNGEMKLDFELRK